MLKPLIPKGKNILTIQSKQILISGLIIFSIFCYIYGYKICKVFYNSDGLTGLDRKEMVNRFWDLRFALYSVIIMLVFFVSKFKLNQFNKSLMNIGFNFALISTVDKLVFNLYDANKYDRVVIFLVILLEFIYLRIKLKKNARNKR